MQKHIALSPVLFELGKHIKEIRNSKHISQTELGINCDMEKSTISKIEAGLVNVGYLSLHRISKGLEVSICELSQEKKQD